jgi:hypothetical protein
VAIFSSWDFLMATFKDLDPLTYFGKWQESLRAVGWIDSRSDYPQGMTTEEVFLALVRLCADPWQPVVSAGRQRCSLCRYSGGPAEVSYGGMTVRLGTANVFVPAEQYVLVAPTMVVHYIDAHGYTPPEVFQRSVLHCPPMKSSAYLAEMRAHGLPGG